MADLDRAAYLDRVAGRLHLDPETEADVLDELRTHLDDSTRTLMTEGFTADDAERRALRMLGDPDTLAGDLRRAHRGSRRLLAAVGGGISGAAQGAGRGFAAIFGAVFVAAFLGFAVAFAIVSALPDSATILAAGPLDSLLRLVFVVPIVFGASRRATVVVASEARQPIVRAAVAVSAVGGGLLAVLFLFVLLVGMDAGVALVETGIVIAWLAGAASVGRIPDVKMRSRTWVALVLGIALLYVVDMVQVAGTAGQPGGPETPLHEPDLSRIGPLTTADQGWTRTSEGVGDREGVYAVRLDTTPDDPEIASEPFRWTDVRLELWPALAVPGARSDDPSDVGELDPAFTHPIGTAPVLVDGDVLAGSIAFDHIRGLDRVWVVTTGLAPDGQRTVLDWHNERATFHGSLFEWLTSPTPESL